MDETRILPFRSLSPGKFEDLEPQDHLRVHNCVRIIKRNISAFCLFLERRALHDPNPSKSPLEQFAESRK
jgi:hypothetical protein